MSPAPAALNDGVITAQAIGAGANYDMVGQGVGTPAAPDNRIWVGGESELTIMVEMTGAAVGDLAVALQPYEADGVTLIPQQIAPSSTPTTNPAFSGGKVYYTALFDVSAYDMVRVRITNNNAGGQTISRASWRLGPGG